MDLEIRLASPQDAAVIAAYNRAMARETEQIDLDPGRLLAGVEAVLHDAAKGFYLVAAEGGRVVGQTMITFEWSDWRNGTFWWIQSVFVHPGFRGRGVFRRLYEHVLARARQDPGVCGVRLYVEGGNHAAQRTYERLGMRRTAYMLYEVDFVLETGPGPPHPPVSGDAG
jgi:ribosomal protein S18 acetylase RimI-like enzyme